VREPLSRRRERKRRDRVARLPRGELVLVDVALVVGLEVAAEAIGLRLEEERHLRLPDPGGGLGRGREDGLGVVAVDGPSLDAVGGAREAMSSVSIVSRR
jgi:hypothetical protein